MIKLKKNIIIFGLIFCIGLFLGCEKQKEDVSENWLSKADLQAEETADELYEKALNEDTLVIYSVSSRLFEVKETFEKKYSGLTVDIRDIRGDDIVDMALKNYESGEYGCDLIVCSDCDGRLYKELIEPEIIYPFVPWDIKPLMKDGHADSQLDFLGETIMLFYNTNLFDSQPIKNIWEITEEKYKGKIIMASPLSSYSTYGYCSAIFSYDEMIKQAYFDYYGKELFIPEGKRAGEVFWEKAASNIVFTNSSDEVAEGIGKSENGEMYIGIMISSKLRYKELGYSFEPIYKLEPFAAVYTPNSVAIASGSKNINSAKLFVRYLLGDEDGSGEGYKPFCRPGTWSTRIDVKDGNAVPLSQIDCINLNKEYIYEYRDYMKSFWQRILEEKVK